MVLSRVAGVGCMFLCCVSCTILVCVYICMYVCRFTRTRGIRGRGFQKPPPNYVCHSCGGKDHFRQQCPKGKVGRMMAAGTNLVFMYCVFDGAACGVCSTKVCVRTNCVMCPSPCVHECVCHCMLLLPLQGEAQASLKRATGFPSSHLLGVTRQGPGVLQDSKGNLVISRADV